MISAQGSISIKRLRSGDHLIITFSLNGKPLFQGINPEDGSITPDFSREENQVVITPNVDSSLGNEVLLGTHAWAYEGNPIAFTDTQVGATGFYRDASGRFAINPKNGALKIIDNLASKNNIGNDVLTYSGVANVQNVEYPISKSIEVVIQTLGASAYIGFIIPEGGEDTVVGDGNDELKLGTILYSGSSTVTDYAVRWYKDNELWEGQNGKEVTVTRDDVHGRQLFIAEFIRDGGVVAKAGIEIADSKDEYSINFTRSGSDMVDKGKPVLLEAYVTSVKQGKIALPANAEWRIDIMDGSTWNQIGDSIASNKVEITTDHTDVYENGELKRLRDVVVIAEVSWTE